MSSRSDRGIVLVSVLWAVILLSMISAVLIEISRNQHEISVRSVANTRINAALEAGVTLATAALLDPSGERNAWPLNGSPVTLTFAEFKLSVSIQDVLGQFDLNAAGPPVFQNMFVSAGIDPVKASELADAIADWRDSDSLKSLNGAENREYRLAGLKWGPRNGPFESSDEMEQLIGFDPTLSPLVYANFTVFSQKPRIDVTALNPYSLRTLREPNSDRLSKSISDLVSRDGRAFTIRVALKARPGFNRTATIRFRRNAFDPVIRQAWR